MKKMQLVGLCILHHFQNVDEAQDLEPLLLKRFTHSVPIFPTSQVRNLVVTRKGHLDKLVPDNGGALEMVQEAADP